MKCLKEFELLLDTGQVLVQVTQTELTLLRYPDHVDWKSLPDEPGIKFDDIDSAWNKVFENLKHRLQFGYPWVGFL
jgi:hypothetical protein